jgi:hypothetical protein
MWPNDLLIVVSLELRHYFVKILLFLQPLLFFLLFFFALCPYLELLADIFHEHFLGFPDSLISRPERAVFLFFEVICHFELGPQEVNIIVSFFLHYLPPESSLHQLLD